MKYITSVEDRDASLKHIIEINGKNIEVVYYWKSESYGDKEGERYYLYNEFKIFKDLSFKLDRSKSMHLGHLVLAIELIRFIEEEISNDNNI